MRIKEFLELAAYLALLSLFYVFSKETLTDFLEGRTNFGTTHVPITIQDHPTVTVCFDDKDHWTQIPVSTVVMTMVNDSYYEETIVDLIEGDNIVQGRLVFCTLLFSQLIFANV